MSRWAGEVRWLWGEGYKGLLKGRREIKLLVVCKMFNIALVLVFYSKCSPWFFILISGISFENVHVKNSTATLFCKQINKSGALIEIKIIDFGGRHSDDLRALNCLYGLRFDVNLSLNYR